MLLDKLEIEPQITFGTENEFFLNELQAENPSAGTFTYNTLVVSGSNSHSSIA
jgi:hypothetical protein